MQYQVPQFIDVEDKIFGPLTLKQFVYLAGGGGLAFLLWRVLPSFLSFPIGGLILALSAGLAFLKINNKPFIVMIEAALSYVVRTKLYLWDAQRKKKEKKKKTTSAQQSESEVVVPSLSENKLKELSWSLDINERLRLDREEKTL